MASISTIPSEMPQQSIPFFATPTLPLPALPAQPEAMSAQAAPAYDTPRILQGLAWGLIIEALAAAAIYYVHLLVT